MKRLILRCCCVVLALASSSSLFAQSNGAERLAGMRLTIDPVKTYAVGQPLAIRLMLTNVSAGRVTVHSLDSGYLDLDIKQVPTGALWEKFHGGPYAVVRRRSGEMEKVLLKPLQQKSVDLSAGASLEWTFDLYRDFGIRLHPGDYMIQVRYEEALSADTQVAARIDPGSTVPDLIEIFRSGDMESKIWARNCLYIFTGYPDWDLNSIKTEDELKERVEDLRRWWSTNASQLKLEGNRFVRK